MKNLITDLLTIVLLFPTHAYADSTTPIKHKTCNLLLVLNKENVSLYPYISPILEQRGFHIKFIDHEEFNNHQLITEDLFAIGYGSCQLESGTSFRSKEFNRACRAGLPIRCHNNDNLFRSPTGYFKGYESNALKIALDKMMEALPSCSVEK